jgi:hypothetical protein
MTVSVSVSISGSLVFLGIGVAPALGIVLLNPAPGVGFGALFGISSSLSILRNRSPGLAKAGIANVG